MGLGLRGFLKAGLIAAAHGSLAPITGVAINTGVLPVPSGGPWYSIAMIANAQSGAVIATLPRSTVIDAAGSLKLVPARA